MKSLEHIIRDIREGVGSDAVTKFAAAAHDEWRKGFDPDGSGKERIKQNSDGTSGNINVPFNQLHPDWQKENLEAGKAAMVAIRKNPNNMEGAAEHVHNEWMKRNPKADWNASQHVPYSDLPEPEKEKDRVHVRKMASILGKPISEQTVCLEHSIRKVMTKRYESSFGAKDSKPVEEGIGIIGTDKYQGNEFKSIRTATPHIKPPAGEGSHSQAPENASRQRNIAKEKAGINRVTEDEQIDEAPTMPFMPKLQMAPKVQKPSLPFKEPPAKIELPPVGKPPAAAPKTEVPAKVETPPVKAPPKTETPAKVETPSKVEPKTETPSKVEPKTETPSKVEQKPEVKPELKPEGKPEEKVEPKQEAKPEEKLPGDVPPNKDRRGAALGLASGSHNNALDVMLRLFNPKNIHKAKAHHQHHQMKEDTESREKIENMPRKGDRKSIEYVGRKDADPKSTKEKTSRLATIKNVIDEAKKSQGVKQIKTEYGKTKAYDYGEDLLIINPDQARVNLDVDNGEKTAKDYDNK
jgi:hypothetical protein